MVGRAKVSCHVGLVMGTHDLGVNRGRETNLFAAVFFAGKLDLAHAAGTNGLSENPFSRLRWDGGAGARLLGGMRRGLAVGCMRGAAVGRRRRGTGRGRRRHLGRMMRMGMDGTRAAASVRMVGVRAPSGVAAGTALGVGGYARRVVVMLRRRSWVGGAL